VKSTPLPSLDGSWPSPHVRRDGAVVALLERGLIEINVDELGREAYRLTEEGVGPMLAMVEARMRWSRRRWTTDRR
jgi:hypothetical protein